MNSALPGSGGCVWALSGGKRGSERQLVADQQQHRRQARAQHAVRNAPGEVAAQVDTRQRAEQQVTQQRPVHVAHAGVAQARNQGQRYRMGDFGADQASGDQERVQQEQCHGTQGAGADGGEGNHDTQHHASEHGKRVEAAVAEVVVITGMAAGEGLQARLEQNGQCGEDQHHRQALFDDGVERRGVGVQGTEEPQGDGGGGYAAQAQQAGDFPVDVLVAGMHPDATGLGDGGIQQVGADSGGRVDAKPQEDRGHQRAAAHAGHADDETYNQPGKGETERTYIHTLLDCPTLPVIGWKPAYRIFYSQIDLFVIRL